MFIRCVNIICVFICILKREIFVIFLKKIVVNNNKLEIIKNYCNIFINMFKFEIRYLIYIINYLY